MPTFNYELANSAHEMFDSGLHDITASDLARYHFQRKSLGGEITKGIKKRMPAIKRILEKEHGLLVCGVNDHFYELSNDPVTLTEALKCTPGRGPSQTMAGIHVVNGGGHDFLYEASIETGISKGAGKLNHDFARITEAAEGGQLTKQNRTELIENARRQTLPQNATHTVEQLITKKMVIGWKKKKK